MAMTVPVMAASSASPGRSATKERSIFKVSIGKRFSAASEE